MVFTIRGGLCLTLSVGETVPARRSLPRRNCGQLRNCWMPLQARAARSAGRAACNRASLVLRDLPHGGFIDLARSA